MTTSTLGQCKRRALAQYRDNRRCGERPYEAMTSAADVYAHLTVRHTLGGRSVAAYDDALTCQAAIDYTDTILTRQAKRPYWTFGELSTPPPAILADPCVVCGVDYTEHRNGVRFHTHKSAL